MLYVTLNRGQKIRVAQTVLTLQEVDRLNSEVEITVTEDSCEATNSFPVSATVENSTGATIHVETIDGISPMVKLGIHSDVRLDISRPF